MKVCIVGGLQRRENEYVNTCKQLGVKAKIFNEMNSSFENSVKSTDCVVFITSMTSHNMMNKAKNICRRFDIPFIATDRTSPEAVGCALKDAIECTGDCKVCLFGQNMKKAN